MSSAKWQPFCPSLNVLTFEVSNRTCQLETLPFPNKLPDIPDTRYVCQMTQLAYSLVTWTTWKKIIHEVPESRVWLSKHNC